MNYYAARLKPRPDTNRTSDVWPSSAVWLFLRCVGSPLLFGCSTNFLLVLTFCIEFLHGHAAKGFHASCVIPLQQFLLDRARLRIVNFGAIQYQPHPRSITDLPLPIAARRIHIDFLRTRRGSARQPIPIVLGGKRA